MAAFFGTYIDDIRTGDDSEKGCRATTWRVASRTNYLGQQDAPRKRRPPSKILGDWAGAMCKLVSDIGLFVTCSQEKWNKAKELYRVGIGRWWWMERRHSPTSHLKEMSVS